MKDSIIFFITRIIILVVGFITNVLIARWLGPSGKGYFALFTLDIAVISMIFDCGLSNANIYFSGKTGSIPDIHSKIKSNTFFHLSIIFFLTILCAIIMEKVHRFNIVIYFLGIFWVSVETILLRLFIVDAETKFFNFSLVIRSITFLTTLIFFKEFIISNVNRVIAFWCLSYAVEIFYILSNLKEKKYVFKIDWKVYKNTLIWGFKSQVGVFFQLLINRTAYYFINLYCNKSEVGLYSVALLIAETIWLLPDSVRIILLRIQSSEAKGEKEDITRLMLRNIFFISIVIVTVYYYIMPIIVPIFFGDTFYKSIIYFNYIIIGVIAMVPVRIISANLLGNGKAGLVSLITAIHCMILLIFYSVFGYLYFIYGIIFSYIISNFIVMVIMIFFYIRFKNAEINELLIIKKGDWKRLKTLFSYNLKQIIGSSIHDGPILR
ncbi:MAG: hypothetical protein AB1765_04670 [Candidatus Hydrogenedentota bacterium]